MSKTMPKSTSEEKHRWIKPILNGEVSIKAMAQVCPFSERSLKYWLASFREHGIKGLDNKSTKPKSQPNETPIRVKERIIDCSSMWRYLKIGRYPKSCKLSLRGIMDTERKKHYAQRTSSCAQRG